MYFVLTVCPLYTQNLFACAVPPIYVTKFVCAYIYPHFLRRPIYIVKFCTYTTSIYQKIHVYTSHLYMLQNVAPTIHAYISKTIRVCDAHLYDLQNLAPTLRVYIQSNFAPMVRAYMSKIFSYLQRAPIYVIYFSATMSAYSQSI